MQRDGKIDSIRALAILIVMFGHSIIIYSPSWGYYTSVYSVPLLAHIKQWINVIQMPLFFALSGALFFPSCNRKTFSSIVINKAKRILIPYLAIAAIWMIPIRMLVGYAPYAGRSFFHIYIHEILLSGDNGHLWYLPCSYLCFLVGKGIEKLISRIKENHCLLVNISELTVLFLISMVSGKLVPGGGLIYNVLNYFFYFYLGGFVYSKRDEISNFLNRHIAIFACIGLVLNIGCAFLSMKPVNCFVACYDFCLLYSILSADNNKLIEAVAKNSFGMYLIHSPLVYVTYAFWGNSNPFLVVALNFIVFGIFSYIATELLSRTRISFVIGS